MKTLLLSFIRERFYWEKNTDYNRQGWMNYRLYDNLYVYEKYFESLKKMQEYMIDSLAHQNSFIDSYNTLHNQRVSKRNKKEKEKLQAKYASKFKHKHWWNFL